MWGYGDVGVVQLWLKAMALGFQGGFHGALQAEWDPG